MLPTIQRSSDMRHQTYICDAVALREALEEHREARKYYIGGAGPTFSVTFVVYFSLRLVCA